MIYNSLDTIPYKRFIKIEESEEFWRLNTNINRAEDCSPEKMIQYLVIWGELYEQHLSKNQTSESKKIFKLSKNIDELLALNKVILMSCEALKFTFNQEIYDILISYGYKLNVENTESYYNDLDKIEREANAYVIKAEHYQKMLPEPKEQGNNDYDIDDVMASYSAILGFDIGDYNEITYTKYFACQKQVNAKIKSINAQNKK
ncbi:MAG: hypothetical protein CVU01_02910 [Bacteroidetes bacterium HGW-Bacteroidetes-18]|nr:MAG: hypothetical protein CVU01_02910 [Bacteroidetes bacterium HGW-Bacteroidetes-18]